jgi:hypothetical protein
MPKNVALYLLYGKLMEVRHNVRYMMTDVSVRLIFLWMNK